MNIIYQFAVIYGTGALDDKEKQALEHILQDYKRVLKENEILKEEKEQAWEEWNNLEQGSYKIEQRLKQQLKESQKKNKELTERIREHTLLISPYYVKENYIPVQKIKDKIRHYQELQDNYIKKHDEINEGLQAMINVLQELLESEE